MNLREKLQKNKIKKEKSILPGVIFAGLLSSVIVYAVLLNAEKNALADYEKGSIYVAVKEVPEGQIISDANSQEYFRLQELDKKLIPETAIQSPEELAGLAARYPIDAGTLVTTGMFEQLNEVTKDMQEPVIAGFKADDLYQVVGGVLRAGDRIHIYTVTEKESVEEGEQEPDYETGLAWENVFVAEVFDQSGQRILNEDISTSAQRINIYLDKEDAAAFYAGLSSGTLRVVKVCD